MNSDLSKNRREEGLRKEKFERVAGQRFETIEMIRGFLEKPNHCDVVVYWLQYSYSFLEENMKIYI